ncbi:autotransporter outer membrane beta-barrel domain-containing protein [Arthrobacter sp. HLT1-20]
MRFSSPVRRRREGQRFSEAARVPAKPAMLRIAAGMLGLALVAGAGAGAVVSASAAEQPATPEATESATAQTVKATSPAPVPTAQEQGPAAPQAPASSAPAPAEVPAPAVPPAPASSAPVPISSAPAPAEVPTSVPTPTSTPDAAKVLPQAQALAAAITPLTCQNGTVYTIDSDGTLRLVNTSTAAQTTIGDISSENDLNALALTRDGQYAYAVDDTSDDGDVTVYRYASATGVTTSHNGVRNLNEEGGTFVMGGINPATGIYYYGRVVNSRLELFGFNTASNANIGRVGFIAITNDSSGASRSNGDLVFSSDGIMYFVASSNTTASDSNALMRVDQALPVTSSSATLTATRINYLNINNEAQRFNGIAFDAGYLYLDTSGRDFYKVDPSSGTIVGAKKTLSNGTPVDMASCQYHNTLLVQKDIGGRIVDTDQFTLTAAVGGTRIGTAGTTSGSSTGLQTGAGAFASSVPISGTTVVVSETGAAGADLARYTSTFVCTNQAGGIVLSGTGTTGTFIFPGQTTSGVNIKCVFTNSPKGARVTVTKTWVGGIAGDSANFTANSLTGTSVAPDGGTVISADMPQGTTVNVAETLATGNSGAYSAQLRCTDSQGNAMGQGTLAGTFVLASLDVTCDFTNTNAAAAVTVEKKWIVDGVAYENGQQPQGISAALTLTGPGTAGATAQGWSTQRTGYFTGNTVAIAETTTIDPLLNCQLTRSQVSRPNGTTVSATVPYTARLVTGANRYIITNTVTCQSELTLLKFIDSSNGGSLKPSDFTLSATPGSGTALQVPGSNQISAANTRTVVAGRAYVVSESSSLKPAYLQLTLQRYTGSFNANGTLADPTAWADAASMTVSVATGQHAVYRFVNTSAPAFALPLTGGTGPVFYLLAGGGLLLLAAAMTAWFVVRMIRSKRA